ncbi:MAG: hypothetical protein VB027_08955 [Gordonibacter sp.]|nr:hypothetical protein [Gordonibacter sp.]
MEKLVEILDDAYGRNVPIFLEEILDACPDVTADGAYRRIRRAVADGDLVKRERGVYYLPTRTSLGTSEITDDAVLGKRYISNGDDVYGYVTGLVLENRAGISQQVPGTLEIATNSESTRSRRLGRRGGWREVILRRPRCKVTPENVAALEVLDLVTAAPLESLGEYELANLRERICAVPRQVLLACLESYPAKTAKKLLESELYAVSA